MNTISEDNRQNINCRNFYLDENYLNAFVQYDGDLVALIKNIDYACAIEIESLEYIVSVRKDKILDFFNEFPNIVNVIFSNPYTLSAIEPSDAANINIFHGENLLGLRGKGTVVGIVDTGIDYLNPQFRNEDNTSRILAIWDQTILRNTPGDDITFFGTVYTQDEINRAIKASLEGGNPYDIVPSKDENGHGTNMAGLVGAKGTDGVVGGAPECEFLIVKLREAKDSNLKFIGINNRMGINIYEGIDLQLGLRFLYNSQGSFGKPLSILISCGTNWGGHEGLTSIEKLINYLSPRRGLAFVTNTGNQGNSLTHASGRFLRTNSIEVIEFNVAPKEENLVLMLWIPNPDIVSITIVSPSGEFIQPTQPQFTYGAQEEFYLVLENSNIKITNRFSEFSTGNQNINIQISTPKEGLWQLRLKGDYIVNGNYNLWLTQRPLIQPDTRLIDSNPYTTLMSPSNARTAITTSFYDQNTNTISVDSGRGFTASGEIKPNLTTGGIMATTTGLNNKNVVISGGSVAGAVLCGATLLLLEWGIVRGNDPNMSGPPIISYLTKGASRREGDIYPNRQWGFGKLNLLGSFENMRSHNLSRSTTVYELFKENHLPKKCYIKIPTELYTRLEDVLQEDKL